MTTEPTDPMTKDPEDDFDPAAGPGYDPAHEILTVAMDSALRQFDRANDLVRRLGLVVLKDEHIRRTLDKSLLRDLVVYMGHSYTLQDQIDAVQDYLGGDAGENDEETDEEKG